MLYLFSFWITEPLDTFGNRFVNDYPSGILLEYAGRFAGMTISISSDKYGALIQGGAVEDTVFRSFRTLWGIPIGYYNAFLWFSPIENLDFYMGRRTFRLSRVLLWDWIPLEGFGFLFSRGNFSYLFYFGEVNGMETVDSSSLGPIFYPPGVFVRRYLSVRRVEWGSFFFGEYALGLVPPDRKLPLSFLNPFRSYLEIQWNEGYETNTIWSLGYRGKHLFVEIDIDDFQYNLSSMKRVPPDIMLHAFYKWYIPGGFLKVEFMYASPYAFSNRKWVSRWFFYNRMPGEIHPDQVKFLLSIFRNGLFLSAGLSLKGSFDIDMPDPYPDYTFHLPLTEPVSLSPVFKVFRDFSGGGWRIRAGLGYDGNFRIILQGFYRILPL